jgi:hypothetical protein
VEVESPPSVEHNDSLPKEELMNKRQKPAREKIEPVQEKDLRLTQGAVEEERAHVDNPGQTPMRDGQP